MTPLVTVLIPNFNGAKFLDHCFQGLLAQTNAEFECIFLDDGSTDESLEVAKKYLTLLPQLQIKSYPNGGIATNWNRGIALPTTRYFTLLHCDDSYSPRYLEEMLKLMENYPDAAIGHCAAQAIDSESRPIFSIIEFYKHAKYLPSDSFERDACDEYKLLLESDFINCPSVIYRTNAANVIGKFDASLEQTLDWDYWFRAIRCGFSICGTDRKLYLYRRHGNNHTVVNSKTMTRYREELACQINAERLGRSARILTHDDVMETNGLRNILISDIAAALSDNRHEDASLVCAFLEENFSLSRSVQRLLKILIGLGRLGGYALRLAIQSVVFGIALQIKVLAAASRFKLFVADLVSKA